MRLGRGHREADICIVQVVRLRTPATATPLITRCSSGSSASGGAPSQMTSTFIASMLTTGELEKHIYTTLQPSYARRYYAMMAAIDRHLLPLGVTLPQSDRAVVGGYFLWIKLPKPLLADDVAHHAKEKENLIIGQGALFAVAGDERTQDLERQVRLCFSWEEEEYLPEGIGRLGTVIHRMLEAPSEKTSTLSGFGNRDFL
ncbi:MAG: hypothetical protein Q9183_005934 [Haloplaca sp. 2 TL-2023]